MPALTLPRDPLARFLAIAHQLADHRQWWEATNVIRYAALPLVVASGEPQPLVARVVAAADAMGKQAAWFSDLRGSLRHLVAAWLAAADLPVDRFHSDCEAIRARFRAAGVRRGGSYEIVAAVMLHLAEAGDEAHVRQLQRIYEAMKKHHWWLTGPNDLPACALLAVLGGDLAMLEVRMEDLYRRLRERGLSAGSGTQTASHLLCLVPGREADLVARYMALHDAFVAAGVQMWDADRDELALLCLLEQDVATTVRMVTEHRTQIRAKLASSGPVASFSQACGTTFFAAHAGKTLDAGLARHVQIALLAMATNAACVLETSKAASRGAAT